MQACAAGYAVTYLIVLKLHFVSWTVVGLTVAKFNFLYFLCVASPCRIPHTFGFTWSRNTSACVLHNLVMNFESHVQFADWWATGKIYSSAEYSFLQGLQFQGTQSQSYITTGGLPPISSSLRQAPWDSRPVILFSNWTLAVIVFLQHPLWREDGSVVYNCCWSSPEQSFSDPSPAGLTIRFYSLRFETPSTWKARSPYFNLRNSVAWLYHQTLGFLFVAS
jgi:hypothetical protein